MKGPIIWLAAFLFVTLTLVVSVLQITGGPVEMAKYDRDQQRIQDVLEISREFNVNRWDMPAGGKISPLPTALPKGADGNPKPDHLDPISRLPYRYQRLTDRRFEVCAVFELSSTEFERRGKKLPDKRWTYAAGEKCIEFDRKAKPEEYW